MYGLFHCIYLQLIKIMQQNKSFWLCELLSETFHRPWEADSLMAVGSHSVSVRPTAGKHPYHPSIVLSLPAQTPCKLHWAPRRQTTNPFTHVREKYTNTAKRCETSHDAINKHCCNILDLLQIHSELNLCSEPPPIHSYVVPIFKSRASDFNSTLMRHGGV